MTCIDRLLNDRPMKCLGWRTPREVFMARLSYSLKAVSGRMLFDINPPSWAGLPQCLPEAKFSPIPPLQAQPKCDRIDAVNKKVLFGIECSAHGALEICCQVLLKTQFADWYRENRRVAPLRFGPKMLYYPRFLMRHAMPLKNGR